MTYTSSKAVRGALLAATALLACLVPAPAQAAPDPRDAGTSDTWLVLGVDQGETRTGRASARLLLCDPPQGHPRAADACAELAAADGRITGIPARDTHCPMVYAPVTAHAYGEWRGRPVEYTETFPNRCALEARTGSVFALDESRPS
ncbi:SSI family serine proteinase inhibitor [Streptomyces prasinopilosus]|uniref:Subtilisin inhibitor-like n=1 Tax=Streptomyces prasinopilosus TaxID=67344 RepID=A0A1G6LL21_9ACTN|nr:SSI family serine proteinase inhibitor [Streptomyces prasinopilosus]SDC43737.1 Subtilisin inhibitor-like [Streptomyces prasinopilosus]